MVYLRKGKSGILLAFGGYQTAYPSNREPEKPWWNWDSRPFSDIFIYDIYSNTWYLQNATGHLPDPREEFCAGVSAAPDDSSFQITIHGGWDAPSKTPFNDVYVLSVPAFQWIKIKDSDNPDLMGGGKPGRNRHKCDVWKEAQLIVTGGAITDDEREDVHLNYQCNKSHPPFKILDTSTYTWRKTFDPSLDYTVPDSVTAIIGGK